MPLSVHFDSRTDTAVRPGFARRREGTHPRRRLAVRRGATPLVPRRHPDLPGSWRTPLCTCPALRPRRDLCARPLPHFGCCLPPFGRRRLPRLPNISGLNHTARTFAVYASQGGLPHRHARLASGGWPALPGGTGYPLGPCERFQVIPSSFPKLCLAHPKMFEIFGSSQANASEKFRSQKQWGGPPCPPWPRVNDKFLKRRPEWRARRPAPLLSNFHRI